MRPILRSGGRRIFSRRRPPCHVRGYGPLTVNTSLLDSILPSEVQIAPSLAQSVAAGSTMVTVPSSSTMPGVSAINVPPACAVPSDQDH